MYKLLCLVGIMLFLVSCSGGSDDNNNDSGFSYNACGEIGAKIINGQRCNNVSQSAIVRLEFYDYLGEPNGLCTGTAVSQYAVITAAHCFLDGNIAMVDISTGARTVAATDLAVHPYFNQTSDNTALMHDLAIVYTDTPLNVNPYSILLSRQLAIGEEVLIAGYGIDENEEVGDLVAGNTRVEQVTANHYGYVYDGTGANTCQGDSGGPMLAKQGNEFALAAVTSTGTVEGCQEGDLSLYTNLTESSNAQFLMDNLSGEQNI